ncbi:CatA-like O-acetyltransferase [Enterococcus olivae]
MTLGTKILKYSDSGIWTEYQAGFPKFYTACSEDIETYQQSKTPFPKKGGSSNLFDISSIPWVEFSAFNLNIQSTRPHLPPIFTLGKFKRQQEQIMLPVAIQVHHAVCDGYHVGKFVQKLQDFANDVDSWMG